MAEPAVPAAGRVLEPTDEARDDRRLRLILVTDSYPPFVGGADRQTQLLARALAAAGHQVTVVTPWQPTLAHAERDGAVEVVRPRALATRLPLFSRDPRRRHHPPFPDPATTLAIRRLVRRRHADLVHSYGWVTYSAAAAVKRTGVPLLVSARDYAYICAVRNLLHRSGQLCTGPAPRKCLSCAVHTYVQDEAGNAVLGASDRPVRLRHRLRGALKGAFAVGAVFAGRPLLRDRMSALHSLSSFVQQMMDRYLLPAGVPSVVIPSFLTAADGLTAAEALEGAGNYEASAASDPAPSQPDPAALPAEPFILFVGALLPGKGIWPLLAAYERLASPPPLVLIGPPHHSSPQRFPRGVTVLAELPHAAVMAAWDRALFGVVPSVGAETFGNVIIEAMSRGRPVVASAIGGIVDVVRHEHNGLLVPPGDSIELAAAMERLIDDSRLRQRLGRAARVTAAAYTPVAVIPRLEALYRDVIGRAARAAEPDRA